MKYPLFKVHINSKQALQNLEDVFASGFINEGEQVIQLEKELRKKLNVKNITLVNSCTSALTIALRIIGVGKDDEVITTAMTCVATNTVILNVGAKVVWADIDLSTGMISPQDVEKKISSKTKAIMVVDWAGTPCDLESFERISKKYGIPVVQDAAHAFGATYKSKPISEFSDFTCYSFQAIKHFTTGDGGAIVCKNASDAALARKLKWFGYDRDSVKDSKGEWKGQKWDADIEPKEVGYKFNMNNMAAAVGLANISEIDEILHKHRNNARIIKEIIGGHKRVALLDTNEDDNSSYWVYTFRLLASEGERDRVMLNLNDRGIGAGLVHLPNYVYSAFKEFKVELPNNELFAKTQMSVPCGWWLDTLEARYIGESILEELEKLDD